MHRETKDRKHKIMNNIGVTSKRSNSYVIGISKGEKKKNVIWRENDRIFQN